MPVLEDIQTKQNELIRKITAASMLVAPVGAALPTTLTTPARSRLSCPATIANDAGTAARAAPGASSS